jgi:YHS domain-containing protein
MTKDPVCGMQVDETKVKFHQLKEGKTYYFCGSSCEQKFVAAKGDLTLLAKENGAGGCCS